jgi:p-cumate 2,3-dioxygenase beta subunit
MEHAHDGRQVSSAATRAASVPASRAEYEDFLFNEAALLDEWRLDEWFALFAAGAVYEVPTAGAADDVSSSEALFYIADDYERLRQRVARLKKTGAHSEWPRSDGARLISNVRVVGYTEPDVSVSCRFVTFRAKNGVTDTFFGHHIHVLRHTAGGLKIVSKRTLLDMNNLRPGGRISIIL